MEAESNDDRAKPKPARESKEPDARPGRRGKKRKAKNAETGLPSERVLAQLSGGAIAGSVAGAVDDLEVKFRTVLVGLTGEISSNLPDVPAVLEAVKTYAEAHRKESQAVVLAIGARTKEVKRKRRARHLEPLKAVHSDVLAAYQAQVLQFERTASDEELLQFNALVKSLFTTVE